MPLIGWGATKTMGQKQVGDARKRSSLERPATTAAAELFELMMARETPTHGIPYWTIDRRVSVPLAITADA